MKTLFLTVALNLFLFFSFCFTSFGQTLDNARLNVCNTPPGCQEVPICTQSDNCFQFDLYTPKDQGNGTSAIKIKITNFSESTFKQAAFELPGQGAATQPAISPNTVFRNRYNHSVINPANDSMIVFNAKNAGTFSYGGFEVYYYIVNNTDLNAPYGRDIVVQAQAGRSWQQQRFGTVKFNIDNCQGNVCTPPTAHITGPDTLCVFGDNPYTFTTTDIPGATYVWNVPDDFFIDSGQGTNSISVFAGEFSGDISVTVTNSCGTATDVHTANLIECGPITPLPVELLTFNGSPNPEGVILKWSTASEKNNDHFDIERSLNGQQFEKVGQVRGSGNSKTEHEYTFIDKQPASGVNYYRLNQIDFDGTNAYSKIIRINATDRSKDLTVQLNPNPCRGENCVVQLKGFSGNNQVSIELRDITGRLVFSQQLKADQTSLVLPKIDSGNGLYILSARDGNYTAFQKVIIQ